MIKNKDIQIGNEEKGKYCKVRLDEQCDLERKGTKECKKKRERSKYGSLYTKIPPPRQINMCDSYSILFAI